MQRIVEVPQQLPSVVNSIVSPREPASLVFATTNVDKLAEITRILGVAVDGVNLQIDEIQSLNSREVAEKKAIAAWEANNRTPVIVEDTALNFLGLPDGLPATLDKFLLSNITMRRLLSEMAGNLGDRRAVAKVTLARFNGREVQIREGICSGTISEFPRGTNGLGWDDIFEPDGQEQLSSWNGTRRTFAQMTNAEKDQLSMRTRALEALKKDPFPRSMVIYEMPEPYEMQTNAVDEELLRDPRVKKFAYSLRAIRGTEPNGYNAINKRQPFYELAIGPGFYRYVTNPDTPDLGIITTPIDRAEDMNGRPIRLLLDGNGDPYFYEMGNGSVKMALAARAQEFLLHHNETMYARLRAMITGEIKTPHRSNKRSAVIENLLGMTMDGDGPIESVEDWYERVRVRKTVALSELGYVRNYSDVEMSRSFSANEGLIINSSGIPHSIFGLGGMPPVSGWRDVLATAALSYMDSYIPRNSIYADHPELQLKLFRETKEVIQSLGLPSDIEELVVAHIGVSLGCEDLEALQRTVSVMHQEGCRLFRIYTTNPDRRVIDAARRIRSIIGHKGGRISVGPIADLSMAEKLIDPEINTNIIIPGHGAGENCTSLEGGGAANGLELAYGMSLIPAFNNVAIGFEGGVGKDIGAILPFIDVISMNRKGIEGSIEAGGLFVQHANGKLCQPYPGSASPVTQWIEAMVSEKLKRRRVDPAGRLLNNEGVPNYAFKHRSQNSMADNSHFFRMLAGRALADQGVRTIAELREKVAAADDLGRFHREVTPESKNIANKHRDRGAN